MTNSHWQDHFKSATKKAEGLYSKDSTQVSLLMFCLRAKMIPVQEYLNWAKENFHLPVLSEKFFQLHPPQKEFFKKWQKTHAWSVECLPIAEWDGALIVACLELPVDYSPSTPTIFVLASHEVLETTWQVYQKSESSKGADITDMSALAATVVGSTKEEKLYDENGVVILKDSSADEGAESPLNEETLKNSSAKSDGDADSSETEGVSAENEIGGSPEGLFAEAPVPVTSFARAEKASAPPPPAPPAPAPKVEFVSDEKTRKGPRTSEPIMKIEIESSAFLDEKTKTNTVITKDSDLDSTATQALEEETDDAIPSAPVKPTTLHTGTAAYFLEKLRKQNQEKFDKEAQTSLKKMKTFFKKTMLLAIGDKDRLLKPLVWDPEMEMPPPRTPEFNLKTPSIFKIVSGTQKPYHGYVVVNDLNESFFEVCNHGQIPDHVTIVPLMDGEMVVGMLMGLGEKSNYNKNILEFTEATAKEFSQKVLKTPLSKVA